MRNKIFIFLLLIIFITGCKDKTYTIKFDTLGGSIMESIIVKEGDNLKELNPPTKEGYLFVSWLKDGNEYNTNNKITEDLTLTAKWIEKPTIPNYYTINFVMDDKTEKTTVNEGETVKPLTPPEKENYLFLGWYTGDELFDFNTKITKDITLYAKYELNVVTITYDLSGGYGLAIETIPKHTQISIPENPTKEGYKFLKWTLNGEEFNFDKKIDKDITLKAIWEKIEYININFITNNNQSIKPITIEKYSKLTNLPILTKEGYKFLYWSLNNEPFNQETIIDKDITLIAIYEELTS